MEIEITLNGEAHSVASQCPLQDLMDALSLSNQALAVAVNREIVPRNVWQQRVLQPHDKVDIVRAIGGG